MASSLSNFKNVLQQETACCDVCYLKFDAETKVPRMLQCGHTFCEECLQRVLLNGHNRTFCPVCQRPILCTRVNEIPVNYALKQLIETIDSKMKQVERSFNACQKHGFPKQFICTNCESEICGNCVALDHKGCNTQITANALDEMKTNSTKSILKAKTCSEKTIKLIDEKNRQLNEKKHRMETEMNNYRKLIDERKEKLQKEITAMETKLRQKNQTIQVMRKTLNRTVSEREISEQNLRTFELLENQIKESQTYDSYSKANEELSDLFKKQTCSPIFPLVSFSLMYQKTIFCYIILLI